MSPFRLFSWLRWRLLDNSMRHLVRQSLLRVISIGAACLMIWGSLFALSYLGFSELKHTWNIPLETEIFTALFRLAFTVLMFMLFFSTNLILYSSLFTSPESSFLLATPVPADQVFAYKFQGAVAFSSWAFVLMASPILIAYGLLVGDGAPWHYYALLPFFFAGMVLPPGAAGALVCLVLVYAVPRHRKQLLVLLALLIIAAVVVLAVLAVRGAADRRFTLDDIGQLLGSSYTLSQALSSPRGWATLVVEPLAHWSARGLRAAAVDDPADALYYLTLLWANALFLYVAAAWAARRLYRRGFNSQATGGTLRRRYGGHALDGLVSRALGFLDGQTRLLFVKDFRTFRRDPAQWAQILIFVGLAVLYFAYVRRFYEQELGKRFQNGISLINLFATATLMCAYTGRFFYPMLSLEGRKFWILGLLPLPRERLLWGKFVFSALASLGVAEFLSVFGNVMLNMPAVIIAVHALTVLVLAVGLSGLSVGLSALMPNFRETDPSKIAVGFGGTMNLICGLFFLLLTGTLMAGPWHLFMLRNGTSEVDWAAPWWLWLGVALGAAVGALAVWLPLRAGARVLRQMEF